MKLRLVIIILAALTIGGCSSWIRDLNDLVRSTPGIVDSLGQRAGNGLITGIRDSLTSPESKRRLASLLDTLLTRVDSSLIRGGTSLRDTLLGNYTKEWIASLKDELLGAKTRGQIAALRDELLGPKTSALVRRLLHEDVLGSRTTDRVQQLMREGVIGPITSGLDEILYNLRTRDLPGLRDSLLGSATQAHLDSILAHALSRVDTALAHANQTAKDQESFLKKNITAILWTVGAVVALLIAFGAWVALRAYRARKIIDVLTYQIHDYTQRTGDNTLTENIKAESKRVGTEGYLRPMLVKKGLVKPAA